MDASPGGSKRPSTQPAATTSLPPQPSSSSSRDKDHDARRPSQSQLLPPLELLSSSPGLPNVSSTRRQSRPGSSSKAPLAVNNSHAYLKYPTPVPTSSTGILSSSPPRVANSGINLFNNKNPAAVDHSRLQRAPSTVSERAPLSAVSSIELNENGETLLMGRSSNSSHYQLSANRLISRVHVRARYLPASVPLQPNKIEIECNGWNGLKLHCQGRSYDLTKGELMTFETEGAEIMLDVQDARVLINWPKRDVRDGLADLGWEDSPRSTRNGGASPGPASGSPRARAIDASVGDALGLLQSSPLRRTTRISSPESPTPAHASFVRGDDAPASSQHSSILSDLPSISEREHSVEIYEDEDADPPSVARRRSNADQSFVTDISKSFSSDLSDMESDDGNADENNPNEENDPIITSFGPFGANLNSRMASFSASSPKRRRLDSGAYTSPKVNTASRGLSAAEDSRRKSSSTPRQSGTSRKASLTPVPEPDGREHITSQPQSDDKGPEPAVAPDLSHVDVPTITNHVVNQLAFSRLSSNPLSTLLSNLPAEDKNGLSRDELRYIVEMATCIGTIPRQGKDADGKPLESQYYYVPEQDDDENRRAAVVDGLRKPTLRNCRKHHVVCLRYLLRLPLTCFQPRFPPLKLPSVKTHGQGQATSIADSHYSNTTGNARGLPRGLHSARHCQQPAVVITSVTPSSERTLIALLCASLLPSLLRQPRPGQTLLSPKSLELGDTPVNKPTPNNTSYGSEPSKNDGRQDSQAPILAPICPFHSQQHVMRTTSLSHIHVTAGLYKRKN